jgi:hypothetical protein
VSGRQKILLAFAAVLLVGLFLVAVAGRRPGAGDPGEPSSLVAALARIGGGQAVVPPDRVSGACLQPDRTLKVLGSCALHVADPGALKLLVLRSNGPFRVTAPAPGDADYTATDDVTPADDGAAEARIAVDRRSDVLVSCAGALTCALTIGDE